MSIKIERIGSNLVREISYIIMMEVKDKVLKHVTITDCRVTNDLSFAKVYFTTLDDNKRSEVIESLNNAKSFIRLKLADRVDIRHIPELTFVYDESIEYGKKIEDIIEDIHESDK